MGWGSVARDNTHMHTHTHILYTPSSPTHIHTVYTYMCTHLHTYTHIPHSHVHKHIHTHTTHSPVHKHMHKHNMHTCKQIPVHANTHTNALLALSSNMSPVHFYCPFSSLSSSCACKLFENYSTVKPVQKQLGMFTTCITQLGL